MTGFSRSPRLLKGALVVIEGQQAVRQVILFQYNPDTLTRSLRAKTQSQNETSNAGDPRGLRGPPSETIRADIEIDATDQLELGIPSLATGGVYPALAALEALLYPAVEDVLSDEALLKGGARRIVAPPAPLVLFAWGFRRVVPVRISELSITEQAFDPDLNPILAKVSLSMEVLTYQDFGGVDSVGGALSIAHHVAIEVMARANTALGTTAAVAQQIVAAARG